VCVTQSASHKSRLPSVSHRIAVFVRRPGPTSETAWNTYTAPFSSKLWLAVVCATLVLTAGLTVTFKVGRRLGIEESDGRARYTVYDSFIHVFGCMCQQGVYGMSSEVPTLYRVFKTLKHACHARFRSNSRTATGAIIVRISLLGTRFDVKAYYSSKAKETTFINQNRNGTEVHMKYKYLPRL
jgi:hypothetical protein